MPVKHLNKRNSRQKKLMTSVGMAKRDIDVVTFDQGTLHGKEKAIVRQFNQIQKDYSRLMIDLLKELDLVKSWIGTQAIAKRNKLKNQLENKLFKD